MGRRGPRLRAHLGFLDALALALGAVIGAGIFIVLGEGASVVGGGLPLAVIVAAIVASFSALSAIELGVNYPYEGGAYEFGYELLRPIVGFLAGISFILGNLIGAAASSLGFASYLEFLAPALPPRAVAVGLAALALAVNLAGAPQSRRVNNLLVLFKVAVLVIFIGVGLAAVGRWNPANLTAIRISGLPRASALLFFAYVGFARPVTLVEEIRDPARNLPRATNAALASSTLLYLGVAIVAIGLLGAGGLALAPAPLQAALVPTGQLWAQVLISIGGLVATADVLLADIWALSRMAFAMARRGDLPAILGRLTPAGLPRVAVFVLGLIVVVLTAIASFGPAIAASSLGMLVYYGITNLAALRLRPKQRLYPFAISIAGLISTLALVLSLPTQSLLVVGATLAAGAIYFLLWHRR